MKINSRTIRVNYLRDGLSEEFHDGFFQFGQEALDFSPYFLRSCAKPLQASLLIDYKINFTPKELAFCSGSHAGEDCHIKIANQILDKIGLNESMLKCGVHKPLSETMQNKMLLNGDLPSQIHNNCSGKHLGFLAICKKNNWDLETYYDPNHPLQIKVKERILELCEVNETYPDTTDGCGVPIVSMPLHNLVNGYINLYKNYPQIVNAILQNPYIFGGEKRLDTEIIQNSEGILAKVGAGGLCVVLNTKENKAFAVKMNDASTEARRYAVLEIINQLGWGKIDYDNKIKTLNGKIVGKITTTIL